MPSFVAQNRETPNPPSSDPQNAPPSIANQINVAGDVHAAGDFVSGNKIIEGNDIHDNHVVNIFVTNGTPSVKRASPLLAKEIERQPFEPETVLIPNGRFIMGSNETAKDAPQLEIDLPDFRIGKTPVTNGQYAEFLRETPAQPEPDRQNWFLRKPRSDWVAHPVVNISWQDAQAYCSWLSQRSGRSYQLPDEREWEKAARGSDGRRYPWGNQWQDGCANVGTTSATAVGAFTAGASPYGCLDMLGNVQEWTATRWDQADPPLAYVVKSGSFRSQPAELRCTYREGTHPDSKVNWRGFRVVLKVEK